MRDEKVIFCRNIAWLKKRYGLSNRQVAEVLGIGKAGVTKLLKEELPPRLSVEVIFRVTAFFRYLPCELFTPLYEEE